MLTVRFVFDFINILVGIKVIMLNVIHFMPICLDAFRLAKIFVNYNRIFHIFKNSVSVNVHRERTQIHRYIIFQYFHSLNLSIIFVISSADSGDRFGIASNSTLYLPSFSLVSIIRNTSGSE